MNGKHARRKVGTYKRVAGIAALSIGGVSIPLMMSQGTAYADDTIDCAQVGHQVDTSAGDPNGLDADHDGVGCESYPGPATALDDTAAPTTAAPPADYIVKHGDDLSSVARTYGVDLSALEALNPGIVAGDRPDDYSLIYAGGHVHLPVGAHANSGKHARKHHVHVWYGSCDSAPAGLHQGQAGYRHALDMDGDGKACEGPWPVPAPPVTTPPVTTPPITNPGGEGDASGTGDTGSDGLFIPVIAPDGVATPSGYVAHDPSFWIPLIDQAMSIVGGNVAANHDVNGVIALMTAESGGDPNAINNFDSNAQNGTPSEGLMQVIQPTFDANHVAGTSSNLYDPLANIAAALQYINNQYGGSIPNSPY